MFCRARIAPACALLLVWAALSTPPAAAQRAQDSDDDLDRELDEIGEELDEAFEDWGELEDEPAREPRPTDEPEDDPREDMPPAFYDAETWPLSDVERPLALGPGMVEVRASLFADLAAGSALDTISVAPDVYVGVSERFTLGLVHSRFAALGSVEDEEPSRVSTIGSQAPAAPGARVGDGLCFGDDCERPYDNVGVDARLALGAMRGAIQLRVHAGMEAVSLGPLQIGARAGVTGRLRFGNAALLVDPSLRVGLVRRAPANEDVVALPATLQFQLTPRVVVELSSGAYGPLGELRERYQVPLAAGILAGLWPAFDIGASVGFPGLLGGETAPATGERTGSIFAAYRF